MAKRRYSKIAGNFSYFWILL